MNGLSETVVLQNNGGNELTISTDGLFEFDTPLRDKSTYSVTILTSPIDQHCSISNDSGFIDGAMELISRYRGVLREPANCFR